MLRADWPRNIETWRADPGVALWVGATVVYDGLSMYGDMEEQMDSMCGPNAGKQYRLQTAPG